MEQFGRTPEGYKCFQELSREKSHKDSRKTGFSETNAQVAENTDFAGVRPPGVKAGVLFPRNHLRTAHP